MKRSWLNILFLWIVGAAYATNTIQVPLRMSVMTLMPQDSPTGSTPDPTDPTQFRVSLTGNMLTIETQPDKVSYVLVRSDYSEERDENYFYSLCYDSVSCPIIRPGEYSIAIGCWNTDFVGSILVKQIDIYTIDGRRLNTYSVGSALDKPGLYIIRLETNLGVTTLKTIRK